MADPSEVLMAMAVILGSTAALAAAAAGAVRSVLWVVTRRRRAVGHADA